MRCLCTLLCGLPQILAGSLSGRKELVAKVRELHHIMGGVVDPVSTGSQSLLSSAVGGVAVLASKDSRTFSSAGWDVFWPNEARSPSFYVAT